MKKFFLVVFLFLFTGCLATTYETPAYERISWDKSVMPISVVMDQDAQVYGPMVKLGMDFWNASLGENIYRGPYTIESIPAEVAGHGMVGMMASKEIECPRMTHCAAYTKYRFMAATIVFVITDINREAPLEVLPRAIAHELGHGLGLPDSYHDQTDVMYFAAVDGMYIATSTTIRMLRGMYAIESE